MVHLITGRKGEAHISSTDIRSQNRAIYGSGLYRLKDTSIPEIEIGENSLKLTAGSFMWYGLHIKVDSQYSEDKTFSGTQNWQLRLQYSKTASGNDYTESVKAFFIQSTSSPVGFSSDNDTTATTIVAKFTTIDGKLNGDITYYADIVGEFNSDIETVESNFLSFKTTTETQLANKISKPKLLCTDSLSNKIFGLNDLYTNYQFLIFSLKYIGSEKDDSNCFIIPVQQIQDKKIAATFVGSNHNLKNNFQSTFMIFLEFIFYENNKAVALGYATKLAFYLENSSLTTSWTINGDFSINNYIINIYGVV